MTVFDRLFAVRIGFENQEEPIIVRKMFDILTNIDGMNDTDAINEIKNFYNINGDLNISQENIDTFLQNNDSDFMFPFNDFSRFSDFQFNSPPMTRSIFSYSCPLRRTNPVQQQDDDTITSFIRQREILRDEIFNLRQREEQLSSHINYLRNPINNFNFIPTISNINIFHDALTQLQGQMQEDVPVVLKQDSLSKLKKIKFDDLTDEQKKDSCVICMSDISPEKDTTQEIIQLPCNHLFHSDCITPWLKNNSHKCPICRTSAGESKPVINNDGTNNRNNLFNIFGNFFANQ